ncbi:MAG TPA: alpha/beta hydrolase [Abditibacteriaceae bacterium]|nr:alpha/beta hydrolase [Abditibacteriaceae bacterium]
MTTKHKLLQRDGQTALPWKLAVLGLGAAGTLWGLGSLAFAYFSTHPIRRPLRRSPTEFELPFEDVSFLARDGVRLSGWFMPAPAARAAIILCHGFPHNRTEMLFWAGPLHAAGFHLLLFDFRALGLSEGDLCSIGHHEIGDLLGAVDYLSARPEMSSLPVGVFGLSMGGAVALMAAAQDERIAAVATHGAYATLDRAIAQHCRLYFGPFARAMHPPATWWGRRWLPLDPREVSPLEAVLHIAPRPILLCHGGRDTIVRPADARALYAAASEPKQLHFMPRSWHVYIHPAERVAYEEMLLRFFEEALQQS